MFIVCSKCDFKYLINSADLKPNGRIVECANCHHQWFQDPDKNETFSSVPSTKKIEQENTKEKNIDLSKNLKCSLRKYQKDGVNWLRFLENRGFCGILADEMGLGKTCQSASFLQHLWKNEPVGKKKFTQAYSLVRWQSKLT